MVFAAVRKLGPFVATNLDNEMRIVKARGDLSATRKCIIQVLGEIETDRSNQTGQAYLASGGDPHRPPNGGEGGRGGGGGKGRGGGRGKGGGRGRGRGDDRTRGTHPDRPWREKGPDGAPGDGDC